MARFNTSIKIGKYCNAPILIHYSTVIMFLILYFINYNTFITMLLAFIGVLFHEFGHVLAAHFFKIKTTNIMLLPIGGVAQIQTEFNNFKRDFWILAAGPVVNLILCLFCYIIFYYSKLIMFEELYIINLMLFVFNLIPIFPMDGGMLLRGFIDFIIKDYYLATLYVVRFSELLAFILFCLSFAMGLYITSAMVILLAIIAEMQLSSIKYSKTRKHMSH